MTRQHADIVIVGAGIAGLWSFHQLTRLGYDVLLLESGGIGGFQSLASQGIIHSGLKYTLTGKVNKLAKSISAMPDIWVSSIVGTGQVDLTKANIAAESQQLLIPRGLMGGVIKTVARTMLGRNVFEIPKADWPESISQSGFNGSVIHMSEPVLDIPSVVHALADINPGAIRKIDHAGHSQSTRTSDLRAENGDPAKLDTSFGGIEAKCIIFTTAESNLALARASDQEGQLETQSRPLLMGMLKPAPYSLFVHLVGPSEKPVATITTHKDANGELIWYLGGQVAERSKEAPVSETRDAIKMALAKYLPAVNVSRLQWATLPIDRVEGKSESKGWMPDTPTIHDAGNVLYCWPTKLTFAPLLANGIIEKLKQKGIEPSNKRSDWSTLPEAEFALPPWDTATWNAAD